MKKKNIGIALAVILTFIFTLAGILVSIHRHFQYETFYIDFGLFDQAIWNVSRFNPPIIEHFLVPGKVIFADHFNPSIFLLSPLYWITDKSEIILAAQAILVGLSGLVIFFIGQKVLKNSFHALSIQIVYYLFTGLQNAVIFDFHEVTIGTFFLSLIFLAVVKKHKLLFFVSLLLFLGIKELNSVVGLSIGLTIFFIEKSWRKTALITCIISILYGFVAIKLVIPYFSGGFYIYGKGLIFEPLKIILYLFDDKEKIKTMFFSFLSFGFLPILTPAFWISIFQDYILRFYASTGDTRIKLGLHYNAQIAVIYAVSSIYALSYLKRKLNKKMLNVIPILLIISAIILYRFILHGPFGLSYNMAFYKHSNDFEFLNVLVKKVPKNASVMTQNNIGSRFTHQKILLLRNNYSAYKPEYIVLDLRDGQNPNNFFPMKMSEVDKFTADLLKDPCYETIFKTEDQFVYKIKSGCF